ncbi:uncharacterized protein PV07_00922 [Cladophialophora immunda]|uniref:3-hydroxyisobutyrate dehydrogenase n=1 Tax=Cladophialophora immunda TaxID=569365 RepID=A0A0D2A152_9EURO|nr:uncharacterized protein PV07_00922 [Cladophialophora immunda]KIW34126.1 hypothetical protein PV07_00922 [Cladophialophora immunda]OQV05097.1 hypothetical protein CLAIMM_09890 [Cladophialophora immunda]
MSDNYLFVGLGAIGYPMASNIRKRIPSTSTLYIYDVYVPTLERFVAEYGALGPIKAVKSVKEGAADAKVVISIVPTADNVRQVYLDETSGLIGAGKEPERLILECSTIESAKSKEIGEKLKEGGYGTYVDTPVSGGVIVAGAGTLSFMIGAAKGSSGHERIHEVLSMMGSPAKFFWCGKLGVALAAKIANNYLSCSFLLLIVEAFAMGVRCGVDPHILHEVIQNSSGQSFMGDHVCPVPGVVSHAPSSNNWKLGFKTQMMIKDVGLGAEAARQVGIEPRMADTAIAIWKEAAQDPRCVDKDGSSIWLRINDIKDE